MPCEITDSARGTAYAQLGDLPEATPQQTRMRSAVRKLRAGFSILDRRHRRKQDDARNKANFTMPPDGDPLGAITHMAIAHAQRFNQPEPYVAGEQPGAAGGQRCDDQHGDGERA